MTQLTAWLKILCFSGALWSLFIFWVQPAQSKGRTIAAPYQILPAPQKQQLNRMNREVLTELSALPGLLDFYIDLLAQEKLETNFKIESHIYSQILKTFDNPESYFANDKIKKFIRHWKSETRNGQAQVQRALNINEKELLSEHLQRLQNNYTVSLRHLNSLYPIKNWRILLKQTQSITQASLEISQQATSLSPALQEEQKKIIKSLTHKAVSSLAQKMILSGAPSSINLKVIHGILSPQFAQGSITQMHHQAYNIYSFAQKIKGVKL